MAIHQNIFTNKKKLSLLKACSGEILENEEFRGVFKKNMQGKAYLPSLSYIGGTFFEYVSSLPEVSGILIEDAVDAYVDLKKKPTVETLQNLEKSYMLPQVENWYGMLEAIEKNPRGCQRFVREFSIIFENVIQGSIEKYPQAFEKSMEEFKKSDGKFKTDAFRNFDEKIGWKLLQEPEALSAEYLREQILKPSLPPPSSGIVARLPQRKPQRKVL